MYLSLNWLKDFVEIPKSISAEELALRLTMHTVEIDGVKEQAEKFANIIIGKILTIKKHPKADRLQLVEVSVGKQKLYIVCGATNIKVGQLVPVALLGATLPNGVEIKEVEIRGEKSSGMLCAEDELGLGDDHSGIMILKDKAKVGRNLASYLGVADIIFEVDNKSITHRPDLWGHYGMAREIAAFLNTKFKPLKIYFVADEYKKNKKDEIELSVKVKDFELCPRYTAIAMSGIKVEPSPKWMQDRLVAADMRPINNIVDATNYVMLELGQPLHAFDVEQLAGKSGVNIIVRRAKAGEKIKTIDNIDRKLDETMLVIADKEKPIAVAGVMGGFNSEISDKTEAIIIESANFNFLSIRKTAKKLGLRTESSMRFEKALDHNLCELAIKRTVEIIKEICPKAKTVSNLMDQHKINLDKKEQKLIKLDLAWLTKRVGQEIKEERAVEILENLGFSLTKGAKNSSDYLIAIPSWRATGDISIPEDLVEEITRIYGYDNLRPSMPEVEMKRPLINQERLLERKIKKILSAAPALTEVCNYSFVGEAQLKSLNIDFSDFIRLVNPITVNQTRLRQNLAPNLINNIITNQAKFLDIGLFEIGSVYFPLETGEDKDNKGREKLPYQEKRLGIILANSKGQDLFSRLKGVVEHLLSHFYFSVKFYPQEIIPAWADQKLSAQININSDEIGFVYQLNSKVKQKMSLKKEIVIAEINLGKLFHLILSQADKKYQQQSKYPPLVRDLAFVVSNKILYHDIREEIINFSKLIKSVELFDVYHGGKLGAGNKNLAFHIVYQADKTLTANEVDKLQKDLIKRLEDKFEARVRDF